MHEARIRYLGAKDVQAPQGIPVIVFEGVGTVQAGKTFMVSQEYAKELLADPFFNFEIIN